MGIFKKVFGICETSPPRDSDCWRFRDATIEIDLARAPELSQPGGAIRLEKNGLPKRILVIHGNDSQYHAFSNRCSHMGRRIDPAPGTSQMQCCSISQSTYDYSGTPMKGAAKEPLEKFRVGTVDGKLIIRLGKN